MKRIFPKILSIVVVFTLSVGVAAFSPQTMGAKVKSAYLISFLQFIQWPQPLGEQVEIGFLGESEVEDYLNQTKSQAETKAKKKLNITHYNAPESVGNVHILYVTSVKSLKANPDFLNKLKEKGILVVTSKNTKMPEGAGINFVEVNNKLRFEMNHELLKESKLKVSAQLLKLQYKR